LRLRLATTIENLIAMLDEIDGDENLEEPGDSEPWPAWPERGPGAEGGDTVDRELDEADDEDGAEAEPTLGAPDRGGCYLSQAHWADGARGDHEREDASEDEGAQCDDEGAIEHDGPLLLSDDPALPQDSFEWRGAW
jgi:hypothetical protein